MKCSVVYKGSKGGYNIFNCFFRPDVVVRSDIDLQRNQSGDGSVKTSSSDLRNQSGGVAAQLKAVQIIYK